MAKPDFSVVPDACCFGRPQKGQKQRHARKSGRSRANPTHEIAAHNTDGPSQTPSLPAFEDVAAAAESRSGVEAFELPLTELQRRQIARLLESFQSSSEVKDQALALYVNAKVSL